MALQSAIKSLHDHLKASGTGQAKLDVVKAASTVTEAVEALAESYPGTHAKALAFLETAEPSPAEETKPEAKPEPAKGDGGKKGRWVMKPVAEAKPEEAEPAKGE